MGRIQILDDVWDAAHERELNLVDASAESKTLVTTRMRNLGGASQVCRRERYQKCDLLS